MRIAVQEKMIKLSGIYFPLYLHNLMCVSFCEMNELFDGFDVGGNELKNQLVNLEEESKRVCFEIDKQQSETLKLLKNNIFYLNGRRAGNFDFWLDDRDNASGWCRIL